MALSRAQRNALRAAKGKTTRGKVSSAPVSATGVSGQTYKANQPVIQEPQIETLEKKVAEPTQYDPTQDIKALSEAKKKAQMATLQNRLQTGKQDIAEQRAGIPQQYGEQRRKASVQSKLAAKNFGEYLARRGLARSGESAQARLMQNAALQGQLGSIGRQEQSEMDRLAREERGLEQQYQTGLMGAEAGIGAQEMQALLSARQRQSDIDRQMGIRSEDLAREDMLRQQQARSQYLQSMGISDPYGGRTLTPEQLSSVSQYSDDYAAALQDPNIDPTTRAKIEQARFEKIMGDRGLMEKYGRQYMTPEAIQQQEAQYAQQIANNALPDYQAEIDTVAGDNDPTNDWKLPLLQAERQRKIAKMEVSQQEKMAEEQERAMDIWETTGIASQFVASALGVPVGSRTSDRVYRDAQIKISEQKANIEKQRADTAQAKETRLSTETQDKEKKLTYQQAASDINDIAYDKTFEEIDKEAALNRINLLYQEGRITPQIVEDLVTRLKLEGE